MIILKKVLNSSVILVKDEKNNEFILLGRGIGYGKKPGEIIEENIDSLQQFLPLDGNKRRLVFELFCSIPPEIFDATTKLFIYAQKKLNLQPHNNLYYLLVDHLNFAIQRMKNHLTITNRLEWEIRNFYPKEFKVARSCLAIVNEELGLVLPEQEAVNIAYHFINCQEEDGAKNKDKEAKLLGNLVSLVTLSMSKKVDTQDIHYMRFITHLKFFAQRILSDKMLDGTSFQLPVLEQSEFEEEFLIANRIKEYVYNKFRILISDEEFSFLIIHINRILKQ